MFAMIDNPKIEAASFDPSNRTPGLSGFIRARNEGDYIYQVIESWLHLLDEIIVVFNDCTDNTEDELKRAINEFGDRIRVFKYGPKVYPALSKQHFELPENSVNSLVSYCNFALSKTTRKWGKFNSRTIR